MTDFARTVGHLVALLMLGLTAKPCPAIAQQLFNFNEVRAFVDGTGHSGTGARVSIDWAAEVKIGSFLGEPVVSTRFRYDLDGGMVTLPTSTLKGSPYETHTLESLPQVAQDMVRLYDVKLKAEFASPRGDLYLISDVGLPGKPGEWSFNVPGSPDWDRLFIHAGTSPQNPRYLPGEEARALVRSGLSASGASVLSAGLTLYDLHNWYERENPSHYLDVYDRALDRLEEGIYLSYGLPTYAGRDAFNPATLKDKFKALPGYKRLYEKYRSLPDGMKTGDNHMPYKVARQQAAEIIRRGQYGQPAFDTDQQILPGGRQAGKEGAFGAPDQFVVKDGRIFRPETGKHYGRIGVLTAIVFGKYVVEYQRCRGDHRMELHWPPLYGEPYQGKSRSKFIEITCTAQYSLNQTLVEERYPKAKTHMRDDGNAETVVTRSLQTKRFGDICESGEMFDHEVQRIIWNEDLKILSDTTRIERRKVTGGADC
ncbi:hypothetical protein [Tritonibacter mobilis]|uniref:hypothetical protein n=1 Tax=Tritonibacter mobilis TaxID=379347 RepID=UPI001CD99075|nr:hypothetical protein [Tritonibacter mobilis]MCA2007953.1 hypothetical protein [Tritonibacter mobilis]